MLTNIRNRVVQMVGLVLAALAFAPPASADYTYEPGLYEAMLVDSQSVTSTVTTISSSLADVAGGIAPLIAVGIGISLVPFVARLGWRFVRSLAK